MDLKKKKLIINTAVFVIIVLFLIILFSGHLKKAVSFLLFSGGIMGLISKSIPNFNSPSKGVNYHIVSYDENSILGPLLNIIFIFVGIAGLLL